MAKRLSGIERILAEILNRAEERHSFNEKNISRIETKLDKIVAVVCAKETDRAQEDAEDRKRLKERLIEAALEQSTQNQKTVNAAEKESWAEFFFGICKPDGRVGKEGSRSTYTDASIACATTLTIRISYVQTHTPAVSLHARFCSSIIIRVRVRANIKSTCLHHFALCTQPGMLFCSAALLLYTAVIVPVQICLWNYEDPCNAFPTLYFDVIVDAFFMVSALRAGYTGTAPPSLSVVETCL